MLWFALLCCAALCYGLLCFAMLWFAVLCFALFILIRFGNGITSVIFIFQDNVFVVELKKGERGFGFSLVAATATLPEVSRVDIF